MTSIKKRSGNDKTPGEVHLHSVDMVHVGGRSVRRFWKVTPSVRDAVEMQQLLTIEFGNEAEVQTIQAI